MYQYDHYDQTLVEERAAQFRAQVQRYQDGALGEEEFRQLRLRNGLYLQKHAYMLRVAIPYGLFSSRQLRMLAHVARTYDRGFGHFTTRQNIQFNWPQLEDVPDILQELASVQMHAIQTSGNVIRNITTDHLAGVTDDEVEDPRPYCEILRQWSTLHPEFSWLPRKFKVAITGGRRDRAATRLHDLGFMLVRNDRGETGFRVFAGGGMGRTPIIGRLLRDFLPRQHLLSYVEAILRIYNLRGRRDNIHKARLKILVKALGIETFKALVEEEWHRIKDGALLLTEQEVENVRRHFSPFDYDTPAAVMPFRSWLAADPQFAMWVRHNTLEHKVPGYRIVSISLKAPGVAPGDMNHAQMDAVADLADRYSFGLIRATHEQNLVLADVQQARLYGLWHKLKALHLATPNIGTLNDLICCPGLDYCNLANASSISVADQIQGRFSELDRLYRVGEIKLKMSGCVNACGHHHVGHIGILGVEKNGEEWYQFTLGGSAEADSSLGERLGPSVEKSRVPDVVEAIIEVYLEHRYDNERFLDTFRRVGIAPFKARVYGDHPEASYEHRRVAACA